MTSGNETVAKIVSEMRNPTTQEWEEPDEAVLSLNDARTVVARYADRIETAHRREIAELRKCLRIIRDNLLLHTIKSEDGKYVNKGAFLSEEFIDDERWRKALEVSNHDNS